jgi:hypothetical protein
MPCPYNKIVALSPAGKPNQCTETLPSPRAAAQSSFKQKIVRVDVTDAEQFPLQQAPRIWQAPKPSISNDDSGALVVPRLSTPQSNQNGLTCWPARTIHGSAFNNIIGSIIIITIIRAHTHALDKLASFSIHHRRGCERGRARLCLHDQSVFACGIILGQSAAHPVRVKKQSSTPAILSP